MYQIVDLRLFPVWRHVKTNSLYHVMGIARCSTNGERENKEDSVIYFSMDYQSLRYREVSEFLDGRFEPIEPPERESE
jgi:hypothetical protein